MTSSAPSPCVRKRRRDLVVLLVTGGMAWWLCAALPGQSKIAAAPPAPQAASAPRTATTSTAPASTSVPASTSAPASQPALGEKPGEISPEAVASARQAAEKSNLEPGVKTQVLELYDKAAGDLKKADDERNLVAHWQTLQANVAAHAAALRNATARLPEEMAASSPASLPASAPAEELARLAAQAQTDLSAANAELAAAKKEIDDRTARRAEIPKLLLADRQRRDALSAQLDQAPPAGEPPELTAARKAATQAETTLLGRQASAMLAENRYYDAAAEANSLVLRQDLATRRQQLAQRANQQIQAQLASLREAQAEQAAEQARQAAQEAASLPPLVRQLAEENERLARQRAGPQGLSARIDQAQKQSSALLAQLPVLRSDFQNIQDRVRAVGLSNTIGQLLRRQRAALPNVSELRRQERARRSEIGDAQLREIDLRVRRTQLDDIDARANALMATEVTAQALLPDQRERIKAKVRDLLEAQRKYLDALIADCDTYSSRLMLVDTLSQQVIDTTENFQRYIDERVLWIRSNEPIYQMNPREVLPALAWLIDAASWRAIGQDSVEVLAAHPIPSGIVALALLAGLVLRRRLGRKLQSFVEHASEELTAQQTASAAVVTLLMIGVTPVVLLALAGVVSQSEGATELAGAVAAGLIVVALAHLGFGMVIETLSPRGLAEAHLRWPPDSARRLRQQLRMARAVALPLLFLIACYHVQDDEARRIVGRLAFIVFMALLGLFALRVLKPSGHLIEPVLERVRGSWSYKLRSIWYGLAVLMPLALAVLAAAGFYYTAIEFGWRMLASLWLAVGLIIIGAICQRWMIAARRAAALPHAQSRLLARQARRQEAGESVASGAPGSPRSAPPAPSQPEVRLAQMRKQSRRLVQWLIAAAFVGGLWLIWAAVVPALGGLLNTPIWTYTAVNDPSRILHVTCRDLLEAVVVLLLTFAATRNIPGLMQIVLLNRLELASSGVYAITALTRYVLLLVGFIIAFGLVGISWGQIQVVVAAVTLGLSFGLQEIFANFISGLILLLERPIRIGDVVTVADVTGFVTRIRTRATTITDFNHKELIVPNKTFITGQLVNWTLSDTTMRLTIPIAILHGSDVDLAQRLMVEAARQNPLVLKDPPPVARLIGLEAKLSLELQVFVSSIDNYRQASHELQVAIEHSFRENKIPLF